MVGVGGLGVMGVRGPGWLESKGWQVGDVDVVGV